MSEMTELWEMTEGVEEESIASSWRWVGDGFEAPRHAASRPRSLACYALPFGYVSR